MKDLEQLMTEYAQYNYKMPSLNPVRTENNVEPLEFPGGWKIISYNYRIGAIYKEDSYLILCPYGLKIWERAEKKDQWLHVECGNKCNLNIPEQVIVTYKMLNNG